MTEQDAVTRRGPDPGLCGSCLHSRVIETRSGSIFRLCERSAIDPTYPRYPALPVLRCAGFEPVAAAKRSPAER